MTTTALVRSEPRGTVVVITLDAPPVNTLRRRLRSELLSAIHAARDDASVAGIVITGAGANFCAGADLAEFDSGDALAEPTLHATIAGALDTLRKPSVAAIRGAALGGGLELALACSARVAAAGASLGLPETTLGFMPGAGGTQRLPRAIGVERALDLIVTGRPIDAALAHEWGLVDEFEPGEDPVPAAIALCERLAAGPVPRLRDRTIDDPTAPALVGLALREARRARRQGVAFALDALQAAVDRPFDEGLAHEFALFSALATTEEAAAARYRFLSERGSRSARGPVPASVAVVGGGTMGRGIALAFLGAGIPTTVIETDPGRATAASESILASLAESASRGRITDAERDRQAAMLSTAVGVAAAADADLVVEAVFEDLDVKTGVFRELDAVAKPGAVLASNTSSLDLNAIAAATSRPFDVVGMHFFSPANVMKLVEVVEGAATSPETLGTAVSTAKRLGKIPVVAQVGPGFIGNRIFDEYLRAANLLLQRGVPPQRIDAALEAWGMAMGPFAVLDLVGNDIPWHARRAAGVDDPAWAIADAICERGWFGRKTGAGWYRYEDGRPVINPDVLALLPGTSGQIGDDEIVRRCIGAMVDEAAAVLADGIAASSADIDTVMVRGYGFPAQRGGPWFFAQRHGWLPEGVVR